MIVERYCQNEVGGTTVFIYIDLFLKDCSDFGMKILRNFILYRIPIREKSLNILLNLTQNKHNSIRNNAINFAKILYEKNGFKQEIDVKFHCKLI